MRGLVMLPLIAKGEAIGLIELVSVGPPTTESGRITLATTMAHEAAMALENARMYETARNLADRDPLTGFFNHRYLHERLAEEVVRAVRTHRPLSVVMLDLDDFKLVNDSFGHLYGDGVLVHVAELIRSSLRASDVPARYGGDEFALILPETTCEDAASVAARMLAAFRDSPFSSDGRVPFPIGGVDRHRDLSPGRPVRHGPAGGGRPRPVRRQGGRRQPRRARTSTPSTRRRSSSGRTAVGRASRWRGSTAGRTRWTLRCGRVGPEPVRKYQDPGTDSTGRRPCPSRGPAAC